MKENISIRKNVYSSNKYKEVINTNFSELFSARETFTVEDFFSLYNELFLEIPETGEFSHEALIRKSNQIVTPGNDVKDDEIDNLLTNFLLFDPAPLLIWFTRLEALLSEDVEPTRNSMTTAIPISYAKQLYYLFFETYFLIFGVL